MSSPLQNNIINLQDILDKVDALPDDFKINIEDVLNFKVVGGTTEPVNPEENTIWINTDIEITGWIFDTKEPVISTIGQVWIKTYDTSETEFNTLKENSANICPIKAYQYIENSWVIKEEKIYINGEWEKFVTPLIIVPNNTDFPTSKWGEYGSGVSINVTGVNAIASYSDYDNNNTNMVYMSIDITKYTTMKLVGTTTAKATGSGSSSVNLRTGIFNGSSLVTGFYTSLKGGAVATINNTYDISNLTGIYNIGFAFQVSSTSSYSANFTMTSIEFS